MGAHRDSAGGGDANGFNECADITFTWMVEQCQGLLGFDSTYLAELAKQAQLRLLKDFEPTADPKSSMRPKLQAATTPSTPEVSHSRYATGPISDTFTGIYKLFGSTYRRPGQYFSDDLKTNESIHPSVRMRRIKVPSWQPPALDSFQVKRVPGHWVWKKGAVEIPEYPIGVEGRRHSVESMSSMEGETWFSEFSLMKNEDRIQLEDLNSPIPPPVNAWPVLGSVRLGCIFRKIKSVLVE